MEYIQDETSIQVLDKIISQPKFELLSFYPDQIEIKLTFQDPLEVSLGEYLDRLNVTLLQPYFLQI